MGLLIRGGVFSSLVLLALPFGTMPDGERAAGPIETIMAAREAIGDISGICERKPGVCETGRLAANTVTVRARDAARIAYDALDAQVASRAKSGAKPLVEPAARPQVAMALASPSIPIPTAAPR